jgi:hypothetical protein
MSFLAGLSKFLIGSQTLDVAATVVHLVGGLYKKHQDGVHHVVWGLLKEKFPNGTPQEFGAATKAAQELIVSVKSLVNK